MKEINLKNNGSIKKALVKLGFKKECSNCGLGEIWKGKPITLQLDHINGDNSDNRVSNLRFLCPNCHTQTKTYVGRNKGKPKNNNRPSKKELISLYSKNNIYDISIIKEVSVRTVYDWIKYYDLKDMKSSRKFSCKQIRFIRKSYHEKGLNSRKIAKKFEGISHTTVLKIVNNETYTDC